MCFTSSLCKNLLAKSFIFLGNSLYKNESSLKICLRISPMLVMLSISLFDKPLKTLINESINNEDRLSSFNA